mmetsp:Transcript_102324/g.187695  ORF Transcript_102324/g.187695 Transcript_102324/m.187695 type:complete len:117 (-) Transcript_102324:102-452(-)
MVMVSDGSRCNVLEVTTIVSVDLDNVSDISPGVCCRLYTGVPAGAVEEDAADRGGLPWLTGLAGLGRGIQDSESRETSRCHCNVRGGFNGSGGSKAAGGTIPSADKRCTGASAGSI